mgnify:CR=1 FL=1
MKIKSFFFDFKNKEGYILIGNYKVQFQITHGSYVQWGAPTEVLAETVDFLERWIDFLVGDE